MNVLHFNTLIDGGAAIAVKRLHQSLIDTGINSKILYKYGDSDNSTHIKWWNGNNINTYRRIKHNLNFVSLYHQLRRRHERLHYLKRRPKGSESFSPASLKDKLKFSDFPVHVDIVHLHWIAGYFDYRAFFNSIPENIPIVWTIHDMNPFTGGCHYSWGCDRYTRECGNCPQLVNANESDLSRIVINDKLSSMSKKGIHVVATSSWIEEEVRKSRVFNNSSSIRTIHGGIDIDVFKPKNKIRCRNELGLDIDKKIIVFGADGIDNKRKGLQKLSAAIKQLDTQKSNISLLTFGKNNENLQFNSKKVKHLGHIKEAQILSKVYSAADVFVMPSIYEAFGQVALEAMSCGTPVISFYNGGANDIIENGITGLLAERGNVIELSNKLFKILSDDELRESMGINARKRVVDKFTNIEQALRYKCLYKDITTPVAH